jgi:HAD superfamily hydrolase (TIGR01549 family)
VIFDFIGTLTEVRNYSLEDSKMKLCGAISEAGFSVDQKCFLGAYSRAHEKYRVVRYQKLIEITNAVWISDALNDLGFKTTPEDTRIKKAVNVFFEDYLKSLALRSCVESMLEKVSTGHKLGLISNFTYAAVIHAALRKLEIERFFNAVLISEETGWRKPSPRIFEEALRRLGTTAKETVYVGDSPLEDMKGAQELGMMTIFVPSQFYSLVFLRESKQRPDLIVKNVCELSERLSEIVSDQ